MRLCIEPSSLPWVPRLCHPFWDDLRFNFAKFCLGKITMQMSFTSSLFKGKFVCKFSSGEKFEPPILTGFFLTLFDNDFAWSQKEQTMLFPTLSPSSSAVKQENTRSIYRVIFFMAGGGVRFFRPGPKIFILDHFLWWMVWTALTGPGSGPSPAQGVPLGRQKFR